MPSNEDQLVKLYTDTFIDQSTTEVPYKLLKILVDRFKALEQVAADILDLVDLDNVTGIQLDLIGEKWNEPRNGLSDDEYRTALRNKINLHFYSSNIIDFNNVLASNNAPVGSQIIERLPPEDAEVNVVLNTASAEVEANVRSSVETIRAAGVEVDVVNPTSGDKLLAEDGSFILLETGNRIILE